jgi:streptogramin lyase
LRPRGIFLFLFWALSDALLALAQPTITEYPLPTASSNPTAITKGSDGNLWFIETAANKLGRITTVGTITEFAIPTPNSGLAGITSGPDGNIWFTESTGNKIGKITADGSITEYPLPKANSSPTSITAGPDGNIWFIEQMAIGKITPIGITAEYPSSTVLSPSSQITGGPDGNLWFTETAKDEVARITPSGAITEFPLLSSKPPGLTIAPQPITLGPDGNLWAGGFGPFSGAPIWRINAGGAATPYTAPQAINITSGLDGNLWYTELNYNKIVKLRTNGTFTEYSTPRATAIAVGPDGNIWFTEPVDNKIGKLVLSTVPPDNLVTLSQTSLTFNATAGGSPPVPQTITVTPSTSTAFTVTAGAAWLSVSPSGNLTANQTLTVSVNQVSLGAYNGTYFSAVLVTSGNVTQTILVTLNLSSAPAGGDITVQPTSLNFSYTTPQGTPPLDQEILVRNVNLLSGSISLTISYTISSPSGGKWLTFTQGGNPIPNGGTKTTPVGIYAHVDPTGLSPGAYNATITIAPAGGAAVNIPVTLIVAASPNPTTISVTPGTLTFTWQLAAMSSDQYVQVTESGPQFAFVAQSDSPTWLSAFPSTGSPPATLAISASGMGLAPGTYTGTITIALPLLAGVSAKITVSLTVLPASSLIQEYAVPTTSSQPLYIATGPDGDLW